VLSVTGASNLVVTPKFAMIAAAGGTQQFTATATILNPDGSSTAGQDVTLLANWFSSQTGFATIDSTQDATNGLATAVANGTTQISASYLGANSNNALLTVGGAIVVVGLNPLPPTATLAAGQTLQYSATETMSDGSTQPVATTAVSWTISCTPAGAASIGMTTGLAVTTASAAGASCTVTGTVPVAGVPGGVSGTATITVTAAVARFAYIANSGGNTISEYAANPAGGALAFLGKFPATGPQQVLVHPSGNYLYSIGGNSYVYVYDINPVTGALTPGVDASNNPLPPYPVISPGIPNTNNRGVIDPTGSFLYVSDSTSNQVWGFTIDQSTGALTATTPNPNYPVGAYPTDVLADHTGTYLFVINSNDGDISGFTITPATGVLVANSPAVAASPYTTGSLGSPIFGTIDPTNAYLYVPDGSNNVNGFNIAPATGYLTAFTTAIPSIAGANALINLAIDPGDKYIYVLDVTSTGNGNIYAFSVGTGGAFGGAIGTGPILAGSGPDGIVVDPSSALLAVDNNFSNTISLFQIGTGGALTTLTPASTDSAPLFVTYYNGVAAASVTPAEVVTADKTTGKISAFTAAAGVLTADLNSPYMGVAGNSQIGSSVVGNLFFTGSASGKQLAGYALNSAITPLANSPVTLAGDAGTVIADPSGLYAYVADTTNGLVYSYAYDATTNSLALTSTAPTAPAPALTGLQGLVSHPQGSVIYALASNGTITPIPAYSGMLIAGAPQSIAGNWTVGAVDGSGQYLFAVDSTALKLRYFSITPVVGSGGTDGALTAIGSGTSIPGAVLPAGVVVDPTDRFVLVTDATANMITPFTFNPALGTLTAGTAVSVPSGAGQVTIDPTGKYVFVALAGAAGGSPASGVAAYTVSVSGSTVTLTAVTGSPFTTGTGASGTTGVGAINSVQ
jgi:6-phosphogluconolactonase (cycloisomerase 2 family)